MIRGRSSIKGDLGPGTSMDAEWLALIAATRLAHEHDLIGPVLLGDAAPVIAQFAGTIEQGLARR